MSGVVIKKMSRQELLEKFGFSSEEEFKRDVAGVLRQDELEQEELKKQKTLRALTTQEIKQKIAECNKQIEL